MPGLRAALGKGRVESDLGANDAETVRADERDVMSAGGIDDLVLQRQSAFADLAETGGQDHRGANPVLAAFGHHRGNLDCGDRNHD